MTRDEKTAIPETNGRLTPRQRGFLCRRVCRVGWPTRVGVKQHNAVPRTQQVCRGSWGEQWHRATPRLRSVPSRLCRPSAAAALPRGPVCGVRLRQQRAHGRSLRTATARSHLLAAELSAPRAPPHHQQRCRSPRPSSSPPARACARTRRPSTARRGAAAWGSAGPRGGSQLRAPRRPSRACTPTGSCCPARYALVQDTLVLARARPRAQAHTHTHIDVLEHMRIRAH